MLLISKLIYPNHSDNMELVNYIMINFNSFGNHQYVRKH